MRSTSICLPRGVSSGKPSGSAFDRLRPVDICNAISTIRYRTNPESESYISNREDRSCSGESQQIGAQDGSDQTATGTQVGGSRREHSRGSGARPRQREASRGDEAGRSVSREGAQRATEVRTGDVGRTAISCRRDSGWLGEGASRLPGPATWMVLRARRRVSGGGTGTTDWRG